MTELQEFLRECDCDVIQKQMDRKTPISQSGCKKSSKMQFDNCDDCELFKEIYAHNCLRNIVKLPTTQQLIDMLGDIWWQIEKGEKIVIVSIPDMLPVEGVSPRLALVRAVKRVIIEV